MYFLIFKLKKNIQKIPSKDLLELSITEDEIKIFKDTFLEQLLQNPHQHVLNLMAFKLNPLDITDIKYERLTNNIKKSFIWENIGNKYRIIGLNSNILYFSEIYSNNNTSTSPTKSNKIFNPLTKLYNFFSNK